MTRTTFSQRGSLFCLILCLLQGSAVADRRVPAERGLPEILQRTRSALVHVGHAEPVGEALAVRWLGTGFLVDRHCTILTARHILRDVPSGALTVRLHGAGGGDAALTLGARILLEDEDRDLAWLRLQALPGAPACPLRDPRPVSLAATFAGAELNGEAVLIYGFPALEGEQPREVPIVKQGIVSSAELVWEGRPMLLLDLTGVPGFSGAPVILGRSGEVIGIVFGPGRTERQYDLEWATPVSDEDLKRALAAERGRR
jgi:hypothetical protein